LPPGREVYAAFRSEIEKQTLKADVDIKEPDAPDFVSVALWWSSIRRDMLPAGDTGRRSGDCIANHQGKAGC